MQYGWHRGKKSRPGKNHDEEMGISGMGLFYFIGNCDTDIVCEEEIVMEYITGKKMEEKEWIGVKELLDHKEGDCVETEGMVHSIRRMGEISFVILRRRDGLIQCVCEEGKTGFDIRSLKEGSSVRVKGVLRREERSPHGVEIRIEEVGILSQPSEPLPLPVDKWKLSASLEARLDMRPISLRNVRERARFKIQEGIVRGFRDFSRPAYLKRG